MIVVTCSRGAHRGAHFFPSVSAAMKFIDVSMLRDALIWPAEAAQCGGWVPIAQALKLDLWCFWMAEETQWIGLLKERLLQ